MRYEDSVKNNLLTYFSLIDKKAIFIQLFHWYFFIHFFVHFNFNNSGEFLNILFQLSSLLNLVYKL